MLKETTLFICRYAGDLEGKKPDRVPNCNGSRCFERCNYTTDPSKAKYKDHRVFQIDRNGNRWEVMRG